MQREQQKLKSDYFATKKELEAKNKELENALKNSGSGASNVPPTPPTPPTPPPTPPVDAVDEPDLDLDQPDVSVLSSHLFVIHADLAQDLNEEQ